MNSKIKKIIKELRFYTILVIVSLVFAVGLRVFVLAPITRIPSWSMSPTVMGGDYIIVTKLIPGPRVYRDIRQIRVEGKVHTKRFKGVRKIKRNDVLLFNFPYVAEWDKIDMNLNLLYLKRCVALPGDTFSIESGMYRVNNYPNSLGYVSQQQELSQKSQKDFSSGAWHCFPGDTVHYQWNIKDFGPLCVPEAGTTVVLDTFNVSLYKNLIEYETDKKISIRDGLVYSDEDKINTYTFKLNYYFMAGDNTFDSEDSRYWGLLPEDCIIGKAILIWRSTDRYTGKIRWDRFFKTIR